MIKVVIQLLINKLNPRCFVHLPDATVVIFGFPGTSFRRVIPDAGPANTNPEKVRKLLLCTGKVYYELVKVHDSSQLDGKYSQVNC